MNATTVDLRYRTHDVLRSLDRGETVVITFRGKTKGIICPPQQAPTLRSAPSKVVEHPFFASASADGEPVSAVMDRFRGGRCRDL